MSPTRFKVDVHGCSRRGVLLVSVMARAALRTCWARAKKTHATRKVAVGTAKKPAASSCRWQKSHPSGKPWASKIFPGILGGMAVAGLKSRRNLLLEILALRQQLLVLSRRSKRPRLTPLDQVHRANWHLKRPLLAVYEPSEPRYAGRKPLSQSVEVGTSVAQRPPHRSRRA